MGNTCKFNMFASNNSLLAAVKVCRKTMESRSAPIVLSWLVETADCSFSKVWYVAVVDWGVSGGMMDLTDAIFYVLSVIHSLDKQSGSNNNRLCYITLPYQLFYFDKIH